MDISTKQEKWRQERPLFEAEFLHSHLLPFFNFNENTGDYEIKSECVNSTDDEDRKVAYEVLNTGWAMWLRAKRDAKAQAVPEGFVLVKTSDRDQEMLELIDQRDHMEGQAEELKDKLQALYGVNFGEHSSCNFPFQNAIDYDDSDFVLVKKNHLSEVVEKIERMFEEDSLLALGELLPIQQGIKAMIEARELAND